MITEEIAHIKGNPKKLIVFLHGYIDSFDYVDSKISDYIHDINDIAVHIPKSPFVSEVYDKKFQWYSMHQFDPNDDRKTVATLEEAVLIYSRMKPAIMQSAIMINDYIENLLCEYGLTRKDLFICGYSQGSTMAIYLSLMSEEKIAGCVSFSGIVAPVSYLLQNHKTSPNFLLIHGDTDNQVRFEAMDFTRENLKKMGCNVFTHTISGGLHRIDDEGVSASVAFIKKVLG